MASWFIPALKAVLPHVGDIISAATPVFTRKKGADVADQTTLLQQQVGELQAAVSQNAGYIKELAEQLEKTVATLEQAGALAESRLRRAFLLSMATAVIAVVALAVALVAVVGR
jgi:lipopolysaccharide biosynthesis regulator YciM